MNESCPIWATPASIGAQDDFKLAVDSPRAGGMYLIPNDVVELVSVLDDNRVKARLTSILIRQRRLGNHCPEIKNQEINHAKDAMAMPVHHRADNLLRFIRSQMSSIGAKIHFQEISDETKFGFNSSTDFSGATMSEEKDIRWKMLAHSESLDYTELQFLVDYLVDQSWLKRNEGLRFFGFKYNLTVKGYERLAEIDHTHKDSSRAFVAMWFNKSMDEVWGNGFRLSIEDAGYKPVRIDQKEHVNKIDDEIIAEIRRSRFLVADFTQGEDGARGGVYYEAGFAHGLDIPVIFTCREDVIDEIHFDVRQYNTIIWNEKKLCELREKLKNRISAVIGDGPLRK